MLLRTLLLAASCVLTPVSLAQAPSATKPNPASELPLDDLRLFTRVFDQIRAGYVTPVKDSQLLENAIRGMLSELDPHSSYLDAESFDSLKETTQGEFGGLGMEVSSEKGAIKVVSPIDDTPASKAGIMSGDIILDIDKKSLKNRTLGEAIQMMRGKVGTSITLTIYRKGVKEPFDVTLKRAIIKVTSVRSELVDPHYGYIRIAQFQNKTGADFKQAVAKMAKKSSDLKGLVLDLRNNPGGVLSASVDVVDAVTDGGKVVSTQGRLDNTNREYTASPGDMTDNLPIVVLINDGSASASEIVAGALQDHKRAIILGTRSFGKGSVQTVIPMSNTKAIKLTTALYYTPKGRSIQAQGIEPDIIVERAEINRTSRRPKRAEADLLGHLGNGNGGADITSADKSANKLNQRVATDNQLYAAINLLKGIAVLKQ